VPAGRRHGQRQSTAHERRQAGPGNGQRIVRRVETGNGRRADGGRRRADRHPDAFRVTGTGGRSGRRRGQLTERRRCTAGRAAVVMSEHGTGGLAAVMIAAAVVLVVGH